MSKILSFQNSFYSLNNNYPTNSILINNKLSTEPMPISTTKISNYNLSNDSFDNLYCFDLKITTKNDNQDKKTFLCYNTKEYANLIKTSHKIEFDNLDKYEINVNHGDISYKLKGEINNNMSSYVDKNDNIFIEFSQDAFGHTDCTCYFLKKNIDCLCISPPN
jgi:hypothetical protein